MNGGHILTCLNIGRITLVDGAVAYTVVGEGNVITTGQESTCDATEVTSTIDGDTGSRAIPNGITTGTKCATNNTTGLISTLIYFVRVKERLRGNSISGCCSNNRATLDYQT